MMNKLEVDVLENTSIIAPGTLAQQIMSLNDRYSILQLPHAQAIIDEIETNVRSRQMLLSFDVFDTVLLRNHRSELTRFFEVSALVSAYINQRCHVATNANDVLFARLTANRLSYRLSPMLLGCREGKIAEIYSLVLAQLGVPNVTELVADCIEIELQYEVTQLTVNQPLINLMQRHVAQGGRVMYLSDMYLSREHIDQLFVRLGIDIRLFATAFSSADTIISKRSGKIWPWLCEHLAIPPSDLLHVGDSLYSDYQSPRFNGITSVHIPIPLQMRRDIVADHGALVQQLESANLPIQNWISTPHW